MSPAASNIPDPEPDATVSDPAPLTDAEKTYGRTGSIIGQRGRWYSEASVERIVAARVAEAVERERAAWATKAADEMWRVFLRLPHTPSPLGDYIQRRVNELRALLTADDTEATP